MQPDLMLSLSGSQALVTWLKPSPLGAGRPLYLPTLSSAAKGGTGRVMGSTPANCSWTAKPDIAWVTVMGGSSGGGN